MSVCLRARWTLGQVKERYLKYENTIDELIFRTLAGVPHMPGEFGVSPCYFHTNAALNFTKYTFYFIIPKWNVKAINFYWFYDVMFHFSQKMDKR